MVTKELFPEAENYEALDGRYQAVVDKQVTERYGERAYWGPKGPLYKKKDEHDADLIEDLQEGADDWLAKAPQDEGWSPKIFRKGSGKWLGYNVLRQKHRDYLYGSKWDEDKGRLVGGLFDELYDMDKPREEPEEGTREHTLWQYFKIFEDATDPDTGKLDWEEFDKLDARFWTGLKKDQVDMVLDNIRLMEGDFPEHVKKFRNAGRYAASLVLTVNGHTGTYYDLENHDLVAQRLAELAGVERVVAEEYLEKPLLEREQMLKRPGAEGLARAFNKTKRDEGVLGQLRDSFIRQANATTGGKWIWAMMDAGYDYKNSEKINKYLFGQLRAGAEKPSIPYDELYRASLKDGQGATTYSALTG